MLPRLKIPLLADDGLLLPDLVAILGYFTKFTWFRFTKVGIFVYIISLS